MSIGKMDWSRRNANGAVAYPNNQQYLPQSTSSTVPSMTNQKAFVPPNSYSPAQTCVTMSGNNRLLKSLLGASSLEEIANIQLSALSKQPVQQAAQVSPGQYKHSFSPLQKTTTATNQQSNRNVQNPAVSNYQMQIFQNSVLHNFQQPRLVSIAQQHVQSVQHPQQMTIVQQQPQQMTIVQQHVQPMTIVQQQVQPIQQLQSMQIVQQTQAMQQPQPMSIVQQQAQPMQQPQPMSIVQQQAQHMQQPQPMSIVQQQAQPTQQPQQVPIAQQQAQPVQCYGAVGYNNRDVQQAPPTTQSSGYSHRRAYQQMAKSSRRYSQNAQQSYQPMPQPNAQTVYSVPNGNSGPYATSYKALNDKNVPVSSSSHQNGQNIQTQIGADFQTNTLQRDMNNYIQSPQKQMMPSLHSGFANNSSSNVLPSATGQPPPYPQRNTNASNVYNVPINQRLAHPPENLSAQNVQQPVQSYTSPQDQPSVTAPPPANIQQDQRANVLQLLKVYRNVKLKYLLLNRENNLLRQKLLSSSQDNSSTVKPPLISSLPDNLTPLSGLINGNEASTNSSVQSRPPSNTHGAQTPTLYNNSLNAQNVSQSSSHVYPTNNGDLLNQRNYASQMSLGSNANSSGQAVGSATLRDQNPQTSLGSMQANNSYLSNDTFGNLNLSQDGLCITSAQSLSQTPPTSESCNPVHATNTNNFYSNKPLTLSSREAIKASLPLWKSVPQCSTSTEHLEPKQPRVDNSLNTINILEDMVSNCINEATAITMTQKSEHSGSLAPKGVEPQIAIVSPLVQIKGFVNEISQHPKGEDLANDGINGFKDNDCFDKLPPVDATAMMENVEARTPYNVEVSSNCNMDQTTTDNFGDDGFQISGICTLVEGNSNYDSSIAMMFDGTSPLSKTDLNEEHTLQLSQGKINTCDASQTKSSLSPTIQMTAIKSEPEEEFEPHVNIEDGANVCLQTLPESTLPPSDVFDLEPNTVSDQLSELLTEFPFGIKNYISEKSTEASVGNFRETTEVPKTPLPFSCDTESEPVEEMKLEYAMDTSTTELESQRIENSQQCVAERVRTPELPTDEETQLEEDCFDICDSPDGNIHITLLDPDQMNKLFPEDSTKPMVQNEEPLVESFGKESEAPVVDDSGSAINKTSDNKETTSVPDKELFCCLFSWLTHTNGNAPKCNCKLTDLSEAKDLANSFCQPAAMITTEPPADVHSPLRESLEPLTDDFKPLTPDPCKVKLEEKTNIEILPPVLKRPKLEPIEDHLEREINQHIENYSPQEVVQANMDLPDQMELPEKYVEDHAQKELMTYYTVTNEKAHRSKSHLGDSNGKKSKDPFSGSKPKDDPPKLDKLIVKTDFLKNKHLLKMKRKYKEKKMSHAEEGGAKNVQKMNKNAEKGESPKTHNMERMVEGKVHEKRKPSASTAQQPERGTNKLKASSSSDRSHLQSQAPPQEKRRGRGRSRPESHFDKVRKVPTVQEYLERKRELCNKKSAPKMDQREEPTDVRPNIADKHNLLTKLISNNQTQKGQPKSGGAYETVHKKHRGSSSSHGKGLLANKGSDQKSTSGKDKIYLSLVTDGTRRASCEGINLTKLQIRCSPEKPGYSERRKSLDSSVRSKQSKHETKNKETPRMLEFKLYPEFDHRSPTTQERRGEPKVVKEKNVVEGIKSKKEAWCSGGPGKKIRMDSNSEDQGRHSPPQSAPSSKSSQKSSSRPVQDSQATFNAFKQMYHEQRSKSLDGSL